jgi:hypothetical protein
MSLVKLSTMLREITNHQKVAPLARQIPLKFEIASPLAALNNLRLEDKYHATN